MGIAAIIELLTVLAPLAKDGIEFWSTAKTTLQDNAEWTPEYEAVIDGKIQALKDNPQPFQQEQPI